MGNFTFPCVFCGQHLEADPDMVGMKFDCPGCGRPLTVPAPPSQPVITVVQSQPSRPPLITVVKGKEGFFARNKKWLMPLAGGAALLLFAVILPAAKSERHREAAPSSTNYDRPPHPTPPPTPSSPTQTFSGARKFVKEHIAKNDNCRIVAITKTNGDVVVCDDNNWAASGCPKELTDALRAIDRDDERISDVCLTEQGRFIVLFGRNSARWMGIPSDMEFSLRQYNSNNEVIYSASFNDAGDWITVSDEHYTCSATWLKQWLKDGAESYGILRAAAVSTDAAVAVYDGGYKFFGNVPEDLKDALRETTIDVCIIKVAGNAWFFADKYGNFRLYM